LNLVFAALISLASVYDTSDYPRKGRISTS